MTDRRFYCSALALTMAFGSISINGSSAASLGAGPNRKYIRGRVSFQLARAEKLLTEKKFDEAASIFQAQLKRNPKDCDAMAGLGLCLLQQFKLDGANEQFDKALAIDSNNAAAHTGKAMVLLSRLQSSSQTIINQRDALLSQAETEARAAISQEPGSQNAHYALGKVLKEQGRLPDAYQEFKESVASDPQYAAGFTGLGTIDLASERMPDAISNFRQAISINSNNSTAHYGLGEALLSQGSVDEAIKELNISLYQFRNSAPAHLALGKAYEKQGNTTAALKEYERASLIKPEMKEPYAHMASLHMALGAQCEQEKNTVGAFKEYQQAILINPQNAQPYLRMADLREQRGDLELAIAEMRSGAEINPDSWELHQRIGETMLKLGKIDDAISEFERTLKVQPANNASINGLTRALYLKAQKESQESALSNDYEAAEASLDRAIKLRPNDLQLRLAMAKMQTLAGKPVDLAKVGTPTNDPERVAYAEALLAQNQFSESAAQIKEVISHCKSSNDLLTVADLALMIKDLDGAEAAYHQAAAQGASERATRGLAAVAKARAEASRRLTLGLELAKKNQLASATDSFRQALQQNPRLADARYGLAWTEERLSPKEPSALRDSTSQYRAYLALAPNLPEKTSKRINIHAQKIDAKATKIEEKAGHSQKQSQSKGPSQPK